MEVVGEAIFRNIRNVVCQNVLIRAYDNRRSEKCCCQSVAIRK